MSTQPPQWGPSQPNSPYPPAAPSQNPYGATGYPQQAPMGYPAPGPAAYGAAMKHRGPIAVWLGLPLITLGIYGIVWHYKVNKEMGQFDPRRPVNPVMSVLAVTLGVFLIVPPFVSVYNTGKRIREAQRAAGVEPTCSAGLGVFLMFFCSLYVLYYQSQLNKVVERYGDVAPGTQVPLAV